jgi:hypothetical protein
MKVLFSLFGILLLAHTANAVESVVKSETQKSVTPAYQPKLKECGKNEICNPNPDLGTGEFLTIFPHQKNSSIVLNEHTFKSDSSDAKMIKVVINSRAAEENISVLYNEKYVYVKNKDDSNFTVLVEIPKDKSFAVIRFTIVDGFGKIKKEEFAVKYSKPSQTPVSSKFVRWSGSYSLGLSSIQYTEIDTRYSSLAVTAKVGARYRLSDKWTLKGSTFINLLPLVKNNDKFLRIVGVNALGGYSLPNNGSWSFSVNGGGYYLTSFVSCNCFGFSNVYGPEILVNARNALSARSAVDTYLKFALLSTGTGIATFKNNEIALGTGYYFPSGQHNMSVNFDVSRMVLPLLYSNVQLNTYSLSLGMGF